jgi:hypothetical protein
VIGHVYKPQKSFVRKATPAHKIPSLFSRVRDSGGSFARLPAYATLQPSIFECFTAPHRLAFASSHFSSLPPLLTHVFALSLLGRLSHLSQQCGSFHSHVNTSNFDFDDLLILSELDSAGLTKCADTSFCDYTTQGVCHQSSAVWLETAGQLTLKEQRARRVYPTSLS